MLRPVPEGLSDQKIEQLESFLDSLPRAMNFEHLDGFFCALICGPEPVPMSEFLPPIFGGQMPHFNSKEQSDEILSILAEHWKHIVSKLSEGTPYYPFLYSDQDMKCSANDWADAFLLGVQLRKDGWAELLDDQSEQSLLKGILMLREELSEIAQGKPESIPGDVREEIVENLVANLKRIYDHFSAKREAGAA